MKGEDSRGALAESLEFGLLGLTMSLEGQAAGRLISEFRKNVLELFK